jgi:DNA-binding MarR family transcriptional regulator
MDRIAMVVLGTLANCGPSRLTTLAERTGFNASVSRQVADLENAGLLKRTTDPHDRRAVLLEATVEGQDLMSRLIAGRRGRVERILTDWSTKDIQTLGRMLAKLNEATAKYGEQNARELDQEFNNG